MLMQKGSKQEKELVKVARSVSALSLGLGANAGYRKLSILMSKVLQRLRIGGLYIGHSIVSRAVLVGIEGLSRR